MADEIVVVVEPPPPEITVVLEPPPSEIVVSLSEVGLVGPDGPQGIQGIQGDPGRSADDLTPEQRAVLATDAANLVIATELDPEVDPILLFENALS